MTVCASSDRVMKCDEFAALHRETADKAQIALSLDENSGHIVDHFIFGLAFYTGLRISELTALEWRDFGHENIYVRKGKGSKRRDVTLGFRAGHLFRAFRSVTNLQFTISNHPVISEMSALASQLSKTMQISILYLLGIPLRDLGYGFMVLRNNLDEEIEKIYFDRDESHLKTFMEYRKLVLEILSKNPPERKNLFIGKRGPLTPSAISRRLKPWLINCGLSSNLSMHAFRHGYASRVYDEIKRLDGVDPLLEIKEMLGHSNISTTSGYLHCLESSKKRIARAS